MTAVLNLRDEGRARVLRALYRTGGTTRPQLQALTGLSRATVSSVVLDLIAEGLVGEEEAARDGRANGRPAQTLSVLPHAAYAAAADIGRTHLHVVVCDLSGDVVWERRVDNDVDAHPESTLALVTRTVAEGLAHSGISSRQVLGLGVGIACPVHRGGDTLDASGIMPGWVDVDPAAELAARTGLPTQLLNDANAGAIGEWLYGAGQGVDDLVYIRLSAGIGAGVIADGRLLTGGGGLAGEIGHLQVVPDGLFCRCGNRGCLETVASPTSIARLLSRSWGRQVDPDDLSALLDSGQPAVQTAVREAGEAVGRALATTVTLLDPQLVIIGGDFSWAGEILLDPIRRGIERYALPAARRRVRVVAGGLGAAAEVRGAAGILLNTAPDALATGTNARSGPPLLA
ncbi:ROK family transcriptional regulator [Streptacidiphilus sp. N1-12]|uniref:ROK family transcriptional regulator n=2 Tax=Streptacidiphilus alkalitolerans TaxID=3342712 RepID=A0ABV6VMJ2_9ACTN